MKTSTKYFRNIGKRKPSDAIKTRRQTIKIHRHNRAYFNKKKRRIRRGNTKIMITTKRKRTAESEPLKQQTQTIHRKNRKKAKEKNKHRQRRTAMIRK